MTKILIIEDEAPLRQEIVDVLGFEGFEAVGVENGRLGVEVAREYQPDLVISDILMPQLDGYGVLLELRSDPATSTIPFIFLTAKVGRLDQRKGMELGADDYLTKPFTKDELLAAIQARLDKRAAVAGKYEQKLEALREAIIYALPHEFRTPLTAIIAYSDMLITEFDKFDPTMIRMMLQSISKSGMRLWRLIENYLLYAQIEMATMDPKRQAAMRKLTVANPGAIVRVVAMEKAAEFHREADLTVDINESAAAISVSGDNLTKIVQELVDNAFKFSKEGTPVHVRTSVDTDTFTIDVLDHGRGMNAEQIGSVDAYVQFDRKLYEQQGVGLGLIIAKRLTELHAGQLRIESVPNQFTAVCVRFRQMP